MKSKIVSYVLRAVYAFLILAALFTGEYKTALFNSIIFVVTGVVHLLAKKDRRFYQLDCALVLLFAVPLAATFFGYVMKSSYLGEDKIFHFMGGALLAWFAGLVSRQYIKNEYVFYAAVISFAAAVGAFWEVYEWVFMLYGTEIMQVALSDSMLDIIADTLGALLTVVIFKIQEF
jgi:uncharacterized membrane protein YjdF